MIPPANSSKQPLKLLDLSEDLLRSILYQNVERGDLKSLRLVHRGFHSTTDPLLFSKIIIKIYHYRENGISGDGRTIIGDVDADNLSTCNSPLILHQERFWLLVDNVQGVEIRYYDVFEPPVDSQGAESGVLECEENAGLEKIQILSWRLPCSGIRHLTDLSSIPPTSASLKLTSTTPTKEPLDAVLNGDFLRINYSDIQQHDTSSRIPQFSTLEFKADTLSQPPLPGDHNPPSADFILFLAGTIVPLNLQRITLKKCLETTQPTETLTLTQPFLSNLQTLNLLGLKPNGSHNILQALTENKTYVTSLTIDGYNLDIITYLTSYTNKLRSLKIVISEDEMDVWRYGDRRGPESYYPPPQRELDEFKSQLWKFAISAHAGSLKSLTFLGHFTFCEAAADTIKRCKVLTFLALRGEDACFKNLVPVIVNLPSMRIVEFEVPGDIAPPRFSGWCGTSIGRWYEDMEHLPSRIKSLGWYDEDMPNSGCRKEVRFRISAAGCWFSSKDPIPASGYWKIFKEKKSRYRRWELMEDVEVEPEGAKRKNREEASGVKAREENSEGEEKEKTGRRISNMKVAGIVNQLRSLGSKRK
ncbi:hypothetical protein TWF281_003751 [Arthrobotrys megalospora]